MSEQCIDKYKALYDTVRQIQSKVYEIAYAIQLKLEREEDDDE